MEKPSFIYISKCSTWSCILLSFDSNIAVIGINFSVYIKLTLVTCMHTHSHKAICELLV